jgi:APA family basic amino acid/polyamine antiporter
MAGDFRVLLGIASFLYVVLYLSGIAAQLTLRRSEPDLPRPFRVWAHPLPGLVVLAGSSAFLVAAVLTDTANSLVAGLLIAASIPVFQLTRRFQ